MQIPASMLKVPALFLLTLVITFPSLYVFNALVGSRLKFLATLRLLIGSMAVMLAVLSSIGPIVAFFSISTTSYPFMVLLNVVVFALSGFLGLGFLLKTLRKLAYAMESEPVQSGENIAAEAATPPIPRGGEAIAIGVSDLADRVCAGRSTDGVGAPTIHRIAR